jgi:hypothetical protein
LATNPRCFPTSPRLHGHFWMLAPSLGRVAGLVKARTASGQFKPVQHALAAAEQSAVARDVAVFVTWMPLQDPGTGCRTASCRLPLGLK